MKLAVVLHDVRSVHNVGSIFRTADAAGVEAVYLCGITPGPFDRLKDLRPDFAKVALGAHEYIPWKSAKSAEEAIGELRKSGYRILAVEQSRKAMPYHKIPVRRDSRLALVLGNEVKGLPPGILALADGIAEIPMFGRKESLNVAVAFGIVAFGLRFSRVRPWQTLSKRKK